MRIISGRARGTKLFTLEGMNTRPTLDRVKESLFSIIQNHLQDAYVLDLFAGSGALGIESLSRGAKHCVFCDNKKEAIKIVEKNLEKTKFVQNATIHNSDYSFCLKKAKDENKIFDLIFLDPPYESNLIYLAIKDIIQLKLLNEDGIIIAETDIGEKIIDDLKELNINIVNIKKYGRAKLLFFELKGA